MKRIFFYFLISLIFFLPFHLKAQPPSDMQFMIQPSVVDLRVLRGGTKVFSLELSNLRSEKEIRARIYTQDVRMKEDGSIEFLPSGTTKRSCAQWIELKPLKLEIKPDSSKKIIGKIIPPASVSAGGYYAAIICELLTEDERVKKEGVKITWRIASLIKLTVTGGRLEKNVEIEDLRLAFPEETKEKGMVFVASLENKGNIHVKAEGNLVIRTPDRKRKGQVNFDMGTGTILPETKREFKAVYNYSLPAGDYVAEARFRYKGYHPAKKEMPFSIKVGKAKGSKEQGIIFLPSLSIKPDFLKLKSPGGGFRVKGIEVFNQHESPLQIEITVEPEKDFNLGWIKLEPKEFSLKSAQRKKIRIELKLPEDTKEGKYKAKMVFEPEFLDKKPGEILDKVNLDLEIEVPKF